MIRTNFSDEFRLNSAKMTIKQRTTEWYKARIGKFTASHFADLMANPADGVSTWSKSALKYINNLAYQLYSNAYIEKPDNEATRWGMNNEDYAIREFGIKSGYEVREAGFILHPEIPEVGATPDLYLTDNKYPGETIIAQVKCPFNQQIHLDYIRKINCTSSLKRSKSEYYWQMQGEIWITGAIFSYFVSFDPRLKTDSRIHYVRIDRDEGAIVQLESVIYKAIALRDEMVENFKRGKGFFQ